MCKYYVCNNFIFCSFLFWVKCCNNLLQSRTNANNLLLVPLLLQFYIAQL